MRHKIIDSPLPKRLILRDQVLNNPDFQIFLGQSILTTKEFDENPKLSTRDRRGWLKSILISTEMLYTNRWGYWLSVLSSDEITEPIPRIYFEAVPSTPEVDNVFAEMLAAAGDSPSAFFDIIDWILWGLGSPLVARFPDISLRVDRAWLKIFELHPFYYKPTDYFAQLLFTYSSSFFGRKLGYFPTPMALCLSAVELDVNKSTLNWREMAVASFFEPCCGTGSIFLARSNYHLNIAGNDINPIAVKCAVINACLYVPWVAHRPRGLAIFGEEPAFKKRLDVRLDGLCQGRGGSDEAIRSFRAVSGSLNGSAGDLVQVPDLTT